MDTMDIRKYWLKNENDRLSAQVAWLMAENRRLHEAKFAKEPRHTGWWVLVKKMGEEWQPVCCVDEKDERWETEELPEFTQILPIWDPDDVLEWDGF